MIVLLSPAKTMGVTPSNPEICADASTPRFLSMAEELVNTIVQIPREKLQKRMKMSDALTDRTIKEYRQWSVAAHTAGGVPALAAFTGTVFQALDAATLSRDIWQRAQNGAPGLRILSALYGVLRPGDRVLPHRLEASSEIYRFWGDLITEDLLAESDEEILNLASQEYSLLIDMKRLENAGKTVCTPVFRESRGGTTRTVAIHAKKQRGAMARWILTSSLPSVAHVPEYQLHGYVWRAELSTAKEPVFVR